jgi:hypothetical protein
MGLEENDKSYLSRKQVGLRVGAKGDFKSPFNKEPKS